MHFKSLIIPASLGFAALLFGSSPALAQKPSLGSAQRFAVLGASTVTSTGPSAVAGDLGVSPGTAVTGFPPGTMTGALHAGDPAALQAQADLTAAYNGLAGAVSTGTLTGQDLGGRTLTPGVYRFAASAPLNGVLTLDAQGNSDAVFIFQIGSTLLPAIGSSVDVINGAQAGNVFWQVGSSATLAAGVAFKGNIVALASITLGAGASVSGRALARTGAVTLDTNSVSVPSAGACVTRASVVDLDVGCGPQVPILSVTPLVLGQSATLTLSGSLPLKKGFIMATPFGATVGTYGGCPMYFNASTRIVGRFLTDASGNDAFMSLPRRPILCGTQWIMQAVVFSSPSVVSVSNTLLCTLGT